jgi:hypothetical protein
MAPAIHLDDEPRRRRGEVGDERPDDHLAPKHHPELAATDGGPTAPLAVRACRMPAARWRSSAVRRAWTLCWNDEDTTTSSARPAAGRSPRSAIQSSVLLS